MWAKIRGRFALAVVAILILVFLGGVAVPTYRALKGWRAGRLMDDAETSLKKGSLVEAYQAARSAHGLDANNLRALRMLGDMYEGSGASEALAYRRSAAESTQANSDDCVAYLRAAIRAGRLDLADEFLNQIGAIERTDHKIAAIAADLYRMRGESEKARQLEKKTAESAEGGEKVVADLIRARGLLEAPDPSDRAVGRATLLKIGASHTLEAPEALRILASSSDRTEKETQELIRLLEMNSRAPASTLLLAKALQLELHPDWRGAVLEDAKKLWSGGTQEERLALAEFLAHHGDSEGVLALPPVRQGRAFLLRLDALARLQKWTTLREELALAANEKDPLDPFLVEVFQARVAQEMREFPMAQVRWKQAAAKAAGDPSKLEFLGNFAEKSGNRAVAMEAYRAMIKYPGAAVPGYLGLIRLAEKDGDTSQLRDIIGELARQLPKDPAPKNDFAYLNLLLRDQTDRSLKSAQELVAAVPERVAYRTTLALAFLRKNQPQDALRAYDGVPINWSTALPGWQAVWAAVLNANGNSDEARRIAALTDWNRLKPEERDLIRTLRAPR